MACIIYSRPAVLYGFYTGARTAPRRASRGTRDVTGTARSGCIAWPFPELSSARRCKGKALESATLTTIAGHLQYKERTPRRLSRIIPCVDKL